MMSDGIKKIKSLIVKDGEKDNKKNIENLVVIVIILIITIIAINTIWKGDNKNVAKENNLAVVKDNNTSSSENTDDIEKRLENILSQIEGVGKVKALITYSSTSQVIPLYNQDLEESVTEENDKEGGTRKITENREKKDIIYKESSGEKLPITQSIISPKIEGAIITAKGANSPEVKANIIQAVEAVTGLRSHKIQVFPMSD